MHPTPSVVLATTALLARALGGDARRLRRVAKDPGQATLADVELLVRAHGVPEHQVWSVVDRLSRGQVEPELAWRWTIDYDGNELSGLCSSRLTDREVSAVLGGRRRQLTGVETWVEHDDLAV